MTVPPPPPARGWPDPPPSFTLATGTLLVRIYNPGPPHGYRWNEPRRFGPISDARFDHHPPPQRLHGSHAVWYADRTLLGAVAETFGKAGALDRAADGRRRVAVARVVRPLRLVNLVGTGALRFGLTQAIGTSADYASCQRWARAFYDHYPRLAGIRWRGRVAGSLCVVLSDRAPMRHLALVSDHRITDAAVWPRIARAVRKCAVPIV